MVTVFIDHRERKSGIKKELIDRNIKAVEKQLAIADYVIKTKTIDGKIMNVGVERKTINDFLNSIIDKRMVTQLITLKKHYDITLLILEGTKDIYEVRNFHPNAIRGMLASIAIDFQVPIIQTRNPIDTANLLTVIAKRLEKPRSLPSLLKKRKPQTQKQQQEYIIESLPGVGPTLSRSLLKKFKSIKKLINATEKELIKVEKVGKIKAKRIKNILNKKY